MESIRSKLCEQIERTEHLIRLVPDEAIAWKPQMQASSSDLGHVLGHLLDCLAGFCAVFRAAFPNELGHLGRLQSLPVNHSCMPQEALRRVSQYAGCIDQGFDLCTDAGLARMLPSVFVEAGESLATLLLGNLEHVINHKYQLFFYLKMYGVPVTSRDIYQWRGEEGAAEIRSAQAFAKSM